MKTATGSKIARLAIVAMLACMAMILGACSSQQSSSSAGASSTASGDTIHANIIIIGPDADGADASWLSMPAEEFASGINAADATASILDKGEIAYNMKTESFGAYIDSMTSPYDKKTYGYDSASGKYWQLFYNGEVSSVGASNITLADGDTIVWYYSVDGATVPNVGTGK